MIVLHRTNTARALLELVEQAIKSVRAAETIEQAHAAIAETAIVLETLGANLESQWDDLTSLQTANLGLASEKERNERYIEKLEAKNSALTQQAIEREEVSRRPSALVLA